MIRALTILIFFLTPLATIGGWVLAGPLVGLLLLIGLPIAGIATVVLRIRRSPETAAALLERREAASSAPDRA
jgi:hypothetical protein